MVRMEAVNVKLTYQAEDGSRFKYVSKTGFFRRSYFDFRFFLFLANSSCSTISLR